MLRVIFKKKESKQEIYYSTKNIINKINKNVVNFIIDILRKYRKKDPTQFTIP